MDDLFSTPPCEHAGIAYNILGLILLAGIAVNVVALCTGRFRQLRAPALQERLRARSWSLLESGCILLAIVTAWLLTVVAGLLARRAGLGPRAAETTALVAWTILVPALEIAALVLMAREKETPLLRSFGLERERLWTGFKQGILFYTMAIPVVAFYALLYSRLLHLIGEAPDKPQDIVQFMMDPAGPAAAQAFLAVAAVALMPAAEELFFRGMLLPLAATHARLSIAVCFVSVLFAVVHWHLPSLVPLFLIAVAFSLGYLYSGSIMVPIVMHAAFNAVNLALILGMP